MRNELAGRDEREVLNTEREPKTQNSELRTQNLFPCRAFLARLPRHALRMDMA